MKTGELYHSLPENGKVIVSVGEDGVYDVYNASWIVGTDHGDSVLELYKSEKNQDPIDAARIRELLFDLDPEGDAQLCYTRGPNDHAGVYFDIGKVKVRPSDSMTRIYAGGFRCG